MALRIDGLAQVANLVAIGYQGVVRDPGVAVRIGDRLRQLVAQHICHRIDKWARSDSAGRSSNPIRFDTAPA